MADECADISCTEQVAICLRYTSPDPEKNIFVAQEDFVTFVSTRDTTGETIAKVILNQMSQWGLDLSKIVGQGYDGAGNMSGRTKGAQARISSVHPAAVYVHCKNHSLNLAIVHACKQKIVSNMFVSLREILYFLTSSPKRLQACIDVGGSKTKRLQRMSETRWSQHAECVSQCVDNYANIITALSRLSEDGDQNTRTSASAYVKTMDSFDFVVTISVYKNILPYLTPLSDHLQDPHCDLVAASSHAKTLCDLMQKKRIDSASWDTIWLQATQLAADNGIVVTKPRTTMHQGNRSNTPAGNEEEYWRLNLYIPFIDQLIVSYKTDCAIQCHDLNHRPAHSELQDRLVQSNATT